MITLNPYLIFGGNAEEAFNFYKSVFGGKFDHLMRFKDTPKKEQMPGMEMDGEMIMHVALPLGKGSMLMGCDSPKSMGPIKFGNNFSISLETDSKEEAKKLFDGLSKGGKITMPIKDTFWNAYFGMFTDKFGIHWMVSYTYKEMKK